jgi:hypothetical protein
MRIAEQSVYQLISVSTVVVQKYRNAHSIQIAIQMIIALRVHVNVATLISQTLTRIKHVSLHGLVTTTPIAIRKFKWIQRFCENAVSMPRTRVNYLFRADGVERAVIIITLARFSMTITMASVNFVIRIRIAWFTKRVRMGSVLTHRKTKRPARATMTLIVTRVMD